MFSLFGFVRTNAMLALWSVPTAVLVLHIAVPLLDREWAHKTAPLFFSDPAAKAKPLA